MKISFFGECRNLLGESPLWDARSQTLFWVDGSGQRIFEADADGSLLGEWPTPSMVGSIALAETGLLAALEDGFYAFHAGTFTPLALPERGNTNARFNDGKADRQGRFLSGTMRRSAADGAPGKLYRLNPDASTAILATDIMLSNAICFSPGGETLYFADTLQSCLFAYDYAADDAATNRRLLRNTADLGSVPDGATVDADGCLWVALVQAAAIVRLAPDGTLLQTIASPIPYPSCPAFGGAGLDTLFVTSISRSGSLTTDHPDGGRILRIDGLGVTGLPEPICALPIGASA